MARPPRTNSGPPTVRSRVRMRSLMVGCAISRARAARENDRSRTIRSNATSCAVSIGKVDAQHSCHRLEAQVVRAYGGRVTLAVVAAPRRALSPYWLAWFATLTFFGGFYALLVPLPRYLLAIGLPDWQIGLVLGTFGIASLLGRPLAGIATDRFGSRPVLLSGAASLAVGALGVPATTNLPLLLALRLLQAAGRSEERSV